MATCASCGTIFSEERTRCPQCGAPQGASYIAPQGTAYGAQREPAYGSPEYDERYGVDYSARPGDADAPREPAYIYSTPRERMVMTTGSFLGSIVLMSLPLVGFIIQIVWAAGGAQNQNKRNLARAYLILTIIGTLISIAAAFVAFYQLLPYIEQLLELLETL